MTSYIALLRGIGPGNPNMRNDKLRGFFEELGFVNVKTVISSGNVLFDSEATGREKLEKQIEVALPEKLGFTSTVIIRSREELQKIVDSDPFKGIEHTPKTNLNVTFFKSKTTIPFELPHTPEGKTYTLISARDQEAFSIVDLSGSKTPDLMVWLEKQFSKNITTRTYKTVSRILGKFAETQ